MASKRILLVDDEVNARSALKTLLGDAGYEVREAKDGEEALAQLADFAPAVVLCDVRMPRMDGLAFLNKAKEQDSDATFLMMTAFANVESAVEAMRAGAENYLVKPLALDSLLVFLGKALEKRRLERDTASLRERVHQRYRLSGKADRFRDEPFYRLNVVTVVMPPLRRRKGDIPALVSHFVEKYAKIYNKVVRTLGPGTLNALLAHDWPGNVRELENAVERAIVLCANGELTVDDLPPSLRGPKAHAPAASTVAPGATLRDMERDAILRTLALVDGSTTLAAEMLGISVRKVQYRLKEYRVVQRLAEKHEEGPVAQKALA